MADVKEVWGFTETLSVNVDIDEFLARAEYHARELGIEDTSRPSDSLDSSLAGILASAAADLDAEYEIVDDVLRLWPRGYRFDWDEVAALAEDGHIRTELR